MEARFLARCAWAASITVCSTSALGSSLCTASTSIGGSNSGSTTQSSSGISQEAYPNSGDGQITVQEFASAGSGELRASARSTVNINSVPLGHVNRLASASASFTYDDFIISGPAGGTVPATLNMHLDGTFATLPTLNGILIEGINANIGVSVNGTMAGNSFSGLYTQIDGINVNSITGEHAETKSSSASGILSTGPDLPVNPSSPSFQLPVGPPFSLSLTLGVGADFDAFVDGTAGGANSPSFLIDSLADFSHSLSFAQGGPVLSLPAGYTVNSASANVVNNSFAPEPASWTLVAAGVATAVLLTRTRRTRTGRQVA